MDARRSHAVRRWKSGRVHLADGSNVVVLELPYSTEFERERGESWRVGSENMENLVTF